MALLVQNNQIAAAMNKAAPAIQADLKMFLQGNQNQPRAGECGLKIVQLGMQIAALDPENIAQHMKDFYQRSIFPIVKQFATQVTENNIENLSNENIAQNIDLSGIARQAQESILLHLAAPDNNHLTIFSVFKTSVFKLYQMNEFLINPNRVPGYEAAPTINLLKLFKQNCFNIELYRIIDPTVL